MVTTETVEAEQRNLREIIVRNLEHRLPPATDEQETHRRASIYSEVLTYVLVGSFVALKGFMPSQVRALVSAAMRFGEASLAGGIPRFVVRRVPTDSGFFETLRLLMLVGLHEEITARLRANWKHEPRSAVRSPRFVSRTGRYGESQYRGAQRRRAIDRSRAAVLQAAIHELTRGEAEIDDVTAARLVGASKGPADLSLAALAEVTEQPKRTVKADVSKGRKREADGGKFRAMLELRGWVVPSPTSSD